MGFYGQIIYQSVEVGGSTEVQERLEALEQSYNDLVLSVETNDQEIEQLKATDKETEKYLDDAEKQINQSFMIVNENIQKNTNDLSKVTEEVKQNTQNLTSYGDDLTKIEDTLDDLSQQIENIQPGGGANALEWETWD